MVKKTLLTYFTRKNEKKRPHLATLDFRKSRKIGLLVCLDFEKEEDIKEIARELKEEGKEVHKLVFHPKSTTIRPGTECFTTKDVTATGSIPSGPLASFLQQEFDFLVCLDRTCHFVLEYVVSQSKAKCKVGCMQPMQKDLYDMRVKVEQNGPSPAREVLRYLKMIQHD